MSLSAACSSVATLTATTDVVTDANEHAVHRSTASSAYRQLLTEIGAASSADKSELEQLLLSAIAEARVGSLGHYFLGSSLIRSIASNPTYWNIDSDASSSWPRKRSGVAPGPEVVSKLNQALEVVNVGDSPYAGVAAGIREFVGGDDEAAYDCFHRAGKDPRFALVVRDDFIGARTCRPFPAVDDVTDCSFPITLGEVVWLHSAPLGSEPYVISYCCDDSYFRAFAPVVISSLPADARGLTLHFHVVNPGTEARTIVNSLVDAAHQCNCSLHASFEVTPVVDRAFFASARFIRMHAFLTHFGMPMLFLDVDGYFDKDPRLWCPGFNPAAVNMLFCKGPWSGGFVPWRAFWAGMVYVPFNRQGSEFAELLHRVLAYLWTPAPQKNWFIDQNALYLTYRLIAHDVDDSGFADIPPERYTQLRHGEEFKLARLEELSTTTPGGPRQTGVSRHSPPLKDWEARAPR